MNFFLFAQQVSYTDLAKLATRMRILEESYNYMLPAAVLVALAAGYSIGIWHAGSKQEEEKKKFKGF